MTRAIVAAVLCACSAPAAAQPSEFLLIPWGVGNPPVAGSGSIGMYSPHDGSYLGDIVPPDTDRIVFPNSAILGPDRLIYISDSVNDAVYRYDLRGVFVDEFVGAADGLDNVRGIAFQGEDLLVANNPSIGSNIDRENVAVLRFGPDGQEKTALLPPGSDVSAWDIHPIPGGRFLINNVDGFLQTGVTLYEADGTPVRTIYQRPFPTQICDGHIPGTYYGFQFGGLVTLFTETSAITTFVMSGLGNAGQGLFALEEGTVLGVSFNAGVYVHSASTGQRIRTIREGFGLYGTVSRASLCWADLTGDGVLDFADVSAFLQAFGAGDPAADLAPPIDVYNFDDALAFLGHFGDGCP